jgi:DNA-binding response OmpR family regulator
MDPIAPRAEPGAAGGILWVEGHPDNREFLVILLGMAGYAVTSCDSIPKASQVVRDRPFDVYIVGDCLPHGSNLPLAAEIKAINPDAPVILYSALAFTHDRDRGLQAGAHAYITKPGNLDYLLATIEDLLNGREPGQTELGRRQSSHWKSEQTSGEPRSPDLSVSKVKLSKQTVRRRHPRIVAKSRARGVRGGAAGSG